MTQQSFIKKLANLSLSKIMNFCYTFIHRQFPMQPWKEFHKSYENLTEKNKLFFVIPFDVSHKTSGQMVHFIYSMNHFNCAMDSDIWNFNLYFFFTFRR